MTLKNSIDKIFIIRYKDARQTILKTLSLSKNITKPNNPELNIVLISIKKFISKELKIARYYNKITLTSFLKSGDVAIKPKRREIQFASQKG